MQSDAILAILQTRLHHSNVENGLIVTINPNLTQMTAPVFMVQNIVSNILDVLKVRGLFGIKFRNRY